MTAVVSKKARFLLAGAIAAVAVVSALAVIKSTPRSIVWERDYEKALQMEAMLAESLRKRGYAVYGGH